MITWRGQLEVYVQWCMWCKAWKHVKKTG